MAFSSTGTILKRLPQGRLAGDYSTLKRKRRAGLVPFVDKGGGSIAYLGRDIANIILFGVKAREQWVSTTAGSFSAATGGSAPNPEEFGYFRCRLEGRQVVRVSLRTRNLDEAKKRLTAWFLAQQQGPPPHGPISLAEVLLAYDEAHGKQLVSAADVKISSRLWAEYFRDITAADACDLDRIEAFKAWLAKRDYTPGYINRVLSVGRAALMRAYERRLMAVRPIIKGITGYRGPPKGRPLALNELKRFYNALRELHAKRFFILGIGTGGRPDSIISLDWTRSICEEG